jgi:hypothetical protein
VREASTKRARLAVAPGAEGTTARRWSQTTARYLCPFLYLTLSIEMATRSYTYDVQPDRRDEVLATAKAKGWTVDSKRTEHGAMGDKFVRADVSMILFWVETPWSDARSAGGFITDRGGQRQVYRFIGHDGVLALLSR